MMPFHAIWGLCWYIFFRHTSFFLMFFFSAGFFQPRHCCRVPKGGVFKGGGNWRTLRIPREDWGTLGNIRED